MYPWSLALLWCILGDSLARMAGGVAGSPGPKQCETVQKRSRFGASQARIIDRGCTIRPRGNSLR
jgi:hypothetical protein